MCKLVAYDTCPTINFEVEGLEGTVTEVPPNAFTFNIVAFLAQPYAVSLGRLQLPRCSMHPKVQVLVV